MFSAEHYTWKTDIDLLHARIWAGLHPDAHRSLDIEPMHVATWVELKMRGYEAQSVKQQLAALSISSTGWSWASS